MYYIYIYKMPSKRQRTAGKRQRRNSRKTRRIRRRGGENIIKEDRDAGREALVHEHRLYNVIDKFKTKFPNEMKVTNKNFVDFLNEDLDKNLIKNLITDKDVRISTAIDAISTIKDKGERSYLTNKLAEDIGKVDKEDLKRIFNSDNILKLCKLDEAIEQAFIEKDIVKKGKFFGYSIVK